MEGLPAPRAIVYQYQLYSQIDNKVKVELLQSHNQLPIEFASEIKYRSVHICVFAYCNFRLQFISLFIYLYLFLPDPMVQKLY